MTLNKLAMNNNRSGRNVHRYLIKEAYRIFDARGYELRIEYKFAKEKNFIADLFAFKDNERIVVECLTRPTLSVSIEKQKYRNYCDKLIVIYPNKFVPTFPLDKFYDDSFAVELPDNLVYTEVSIALNGSTKLRLNKKKYDLDCKTHNETINKILDIIEKIEVAK